jgi:glyoxylate utilization-related uncharacterized protein
MCVSPKPPLENQMKIDFRKLKWEASASGARCKKMLIEDVQVRLVEFDDAFFEPDWCRKGHGGYVVSGSMNLNINGKIVPFKKGDAFFLYADKDEYQHKVEVEKGKKVRLVLFEKIVSK